MKKIIVFVFLLASANTYGQDNNRTKDSLAFAAPTEIGTPDGELVSKKIGIGGGTLNSSDNKITLIFPAGALASETLVSIQPTTNFAKESIGKAYQFEPSGIQFQQPVQLVIHYTDKELDEQSPQLLGVGLQNEKGEWRSIRNTKVDTALKTVTGNIKHFSSYALYWAIILIPEKTRIQVSHEMNLVLFQRNVQPGDEPTEELLSRNAFTNDKNWFVNGIPDGTGEFGWVKRFEGAPATMTSRLYKAPAKVPDHNSVEIKVEIANNRLIYPNPDIGYEYPNTMRKCYVTIYDNAYEVKIESSMEGPAGSVFGRCVYKDSGSFVVSLDRPEPDLIEIINNKDFINYFGICDRLQRTYAGNGMINIVGTNSISVHPAQPPEHPYPVIDIIFTPAKAEFSIFQASCPNRSGGKARMNTQQTVSTRMGVLPSINQMVQMMPALPIRVTFEAKEEEQELPGTINVGGMHYKVTVKPVKDN